MEDTEPAPKAPRPRKAATARKAAAPSKAAPSRRRAPEPPEPPVKAVEAAAGKTGAKTAAKAARPSKAAPAKATKATATKATAAPRRAAAATATRTPTATTALPTPRPPVPVIPPPPPPPLPPIVEPIIEPTPTARPVVPAGRPSPLHQLGAEAREWVDRVRDRYPSAGPDALVRLATVEFGRAARRRGATASAAGLLGSVGATGVIAQEQSRLVLAVAYAYGFDPTAAERGQEVVDLLRLPRPAQGARAALRNAGRLLASVAARRVAAALVPLGGAIAGAVQGSRGSDDVARRAVALYRGRSEKADPVA